MVFARCMQDQDSIDVQLPADASAGQAGHNRALWENEERFRLFVEGVTDYAIYLLDPDGRVSTWNKAAERIKGYKASEIIGKDFSCFYPAEDVQSGKPRLALETAVREGHFEEECWRVRKDGSRFWGSVSITALKDHSGTLRGFAKVTRDITARMHAQEALRELTDRLFQMQEEERQRISRDFHDATGPVLSAMLMNLAVVEKESSALTPRGKAALAESRNLASQCVREVRTMSYLLHPPMLAESGLGPALQWFVEGFSERSGIHTTLELPGKMKRLPNEMEISLFRIVQECLTNVHRHSKSATAAVRMEVNREWVTVEVTDTGKGFAPEIREGVGIRGMRQRLSQLKGRLETSSGPAGTSVRAIIPVQNPQVRSGIQAHAAASQANLQTSWEGDRLFPVTRADVEKAAQS